MINMENASEKILRLEFAQIQMIKGTMGGLYLTFMTPDKPSNTYRVFSGIKDEQGLDAPLFQLLAQMGAQGWEIIQHLPPNYLLKRPLEQPKTVLNDLQLVDESTK